MMRYNDEDKFIELENIYNLDGKFTHTEFFKALGGKPSWFRELVLS